MVSRNDLLPGTVISSSRIFRAVSLGTCFRITSRTRSTVLLLAATRHLLQHPQGHRPFTLAVTGRPRAHRGRCTDVRTAPAEPCEIYSRLITIEWPCPRAHASGAVPASSESASGAMSLSTFITRASSSARPIRSLVKHQEARRQSHQQSRLRPNRVRNGLPAGGNRIRTIGTAPAKGSSGLANRRRRHERRSDLQVQVRNGNACLEWLPIAFPFAEGPRVRIRLPPPASRPWGRRQSQ